MNHLITLLACLALAPFLLAADAPFATPEALVEEIYKADPNIFNPSEAMELSKRFIDKNLIALLVREAERSRTEPGAIDFHIPTYAQDQSEIKKLIIKADTTDDKATVKAAFENFGERTVVTYLCEKEDGSWKIFDVRYEDGTTLLKLLQ